MRRRQSRMPDNTKPRFTRSDIPVVKVESIGDPDHGRINNQKCVEWKRIKPETLADLAARGAVTRAQVKHCFSTGLTNPVQFRELFWSRLDLTQYVEGTQETRELCAVVEALGDLLK